MIKVISLNKTSEIVSLLDHSSLHRYIVNAISEEFSNMVENCYYPKVSKNSKLYKDLLYMTKSREQNLIKYATEKFTPKTVGDKSKSKFLYDPYTNLLILIVQDFLKNKDVSGAESAFHLFALRYYTNILYKGTTPKNSHTKICNPDYFQSALDKLSKNHMFVKQKTIPNSIMYYSRIILRKYMKAIIDDDPNLIATMIIEIRSRIAQSMRSFFKHYYLAKEEKTQLIQSKEEMDYDRSHEEKLRMFVNRISKDMCIYGRVDHQAAQQASSLIKFNKKLSEEYAKVLSNPMFSEEVDISMFLLIKEIRDISIVRQIAFIDYVQKLMSIKVTKKTIYFKKIINDIHIKVIRKLNLEKWFDGLSVQSKSISRNFIAYYFAFYIRHYV